MITKACTKCNTEKELSCFSKHERRKDGLSGQCKICCNKYGQKWRDNNKERIAKLNKEWRDNNKERKLELNRKYKRNNKEIIAEKNKIHYKANKERILKQNKEWRDNNKERMAKLCKEWDSLNRDKITIKNSKRRAAKLNRIPNWLTEDDYKWMEWYYKQAQRLSELTGIKHHVDHVAPLQGKNVSGLHTPYNLQILTASENCRKSNKWEGQ